MRGATPPLFLYSCGGWGYNDVEGERESLMSNEKDRISWHPGFQGATEWELKANKGDLDYEYDHPLSKEPLRMDALIIKKDPAAVIQNDIGKIFKTYNVVEYKGWQDTLNIDVFYKVLAYASLYKSLGDHVDEIPAEEVAITIMRAEYPRKVMGLLKNAGYSIDEKYPGIFYVTGRIPFDTQIVVFSRLDGTHPAYRILRKGAAREDIEKFLADAVRAREPWEITNIKAMLEVSVAANKALYKKIKKEEDKMGEALQELMKEDIEKKVKEGEKKGEKKGRKERDREKISEMLTRGKTVQDIVDFCGYPLKLVKSVQKSLNPV